MRSAFLKNNRAENKIMLLLDVHTQVHKYDLSKLSGMSTTTITANIKSLLDKGLIKSVEGVQPSVGRPPVMYSINGERYYMVGVEFFSDGIYTVVLDLNKKILHKAYLPFGEDRSVECLLASVNAEIESAIQNSHISAERILGIGIGIPGDIDEEKGIVKRYMQVPEWEDVHIRESVEARFPYPVFFCENVDCMALAYKWVENKGICKDAVIINIRSGFKISAVFNNKVVRGAHSRFGDFDHIKVDGSNRICRCGRKGCYNTEITYQALCMKVEDGFRVGLFQCFKDELDRSREALSIDAIVDACNRGDEELIQLMNDTIHEIVLPSSWLCNIMDPDTMVICSKLTGYKEFLPRLSEEMKEVNEQIEARGIRLAPAAFGNHMSAVGCAALVYDRYFNVDQEYPV